MFAKPGPEHQWLEQLIGHWKFNHDCQMPDGSKSTTEGSMTCRSLGGMWLICESRGESSDGPWTSIMTLGFDLGLNQFVGTFIGSMMANIWPYHGVLDGSGKRLPLLSHGPKFDGNGTGQYRDTIEIVDTDNWLLTSDFQADDGQWHQFLVARHTRIHDSSGNKLSDFQAAGVR
jgi:hypothetical protein